MEQARLLIQQAEALGEPPEDPLALFSVLYGLFVANTVAFNGNVSRDVAAQFLALAEKQKASSPLRRRQAAIGHSFVGVSAFLLGDIAEGRAHLDQTVALYNAAEHRTPATRYGGEDPVVASSFFRSKALWILGYTEAALVDVQQALKNARESGHAATFLGLSSSFFFAQPLRKLRQQTQK